MMDRLRALVFLPLVLLSSFPAQAQAPATLQLGTPVERTLGPGQMHEFTLKLEENTFIQFVVEQKGVDVIVKVLSPASKSLGDFDTPNGDNGPEHVSFVAIAAGTYRITVAPLEQESSATGSYEIKLLEMRKATEQEIKASRNLDVVKAKGIALLSELDGPIQQIRSPQTRVRAQLQIAQLLWQVDENRAFRSLSDAITTLKDYLASLEPNSPEYPQQYSSIWQLRYELVHILAPRDADAALDFVKSTRQPANPYGNAKEDAQQETTLEIWITDQIVGKDPNRALQIARRVLKTRFSPSLIGTLSQLRIKNPELATQFANEIAEKLLDAKLLQDNEAANLAIGLLRVGRSPRYRTKSQLPNDGAVVGVTVVSDDQFQSLLQKVLSEALSYSQPASQNYNPERDTAWTMLNGLQSMGGDLNKIMTGGMAAVEKKIVEITGPTQSYGISSEYQNMLSNTPVDAAIGEIEKAPEEQREQLYLQLASREANNGDLTRAKQLINERVTNPIQRRDSLRNLEQQGIFQAMSKGKFDEALRGVGALRTARERGTLLASLVGQIGPGRKRATAINFLEQARSLLAPTPEAQDQEQMRALLEIARVYSRYDSKRSLEIVDPLIDEFNEICAAAHRLNGFGYDFFDDEELNLQNGNTLAAMASDISNVMGTIAIANFERARATSDRLKQPEIRLRAYLEIAQQTIQATEISHR